MQNQFKVQRTGSGAGHGTRLLFMAPIGTTLHCDAYESAVGHAPSSLGGSAVARVYYMHCDWPRPWALNGFDIDFVVVCCCRVRAAKRRRRLYCGRNVIDFLFPPSLHLNNHSSLECHFSPIPSINPIVCCCFIYLCHEGTLPVAVVFCCQFKVPFYDFNCLLFIVLSTFNNILALKLPILSTPANSIATETEV